MITTTNPRTGVTADLEIKETSAADVERLVRRAQEAAEGLECLGREGRGRLLDAIADSLEDARPELVRVASDESGLGETRLTGELSRSAYQFRLFAEAVREGSYLEAMIDHAGETPLGPAPDLRRMLRPIGPVAVFGASNFPFAFSVAGGDTASALAAGCPVLIKAHPSHPLTSLRSFEAIDDALRTGGAPEASAVLVFGQDAGTALVTHPLVRAVSFTGALSTGRLLLDLINRREDPIPFYGELSSLNPIVVTAGAAEARSAAIAEGLYGSVTGSGGQLCTKPGIVFVPAGAAGERILEEVRSRTDRGQQQVLLNRRIYDSFDQIAGRLVAGGARMAARGPEPDGDGFVVPPTVLTVRASELTEALTEECFGPLVIVATYDDVKQIQEAVARMPASLTATIHAEDDETELAGELSRLLEPRVGRLLFNGYPTGVRVSWAQHHGGPWPSTNSQHTSVGVTAIRRFLRPFVWQNAPVSVLPEELREGYLGVPRRIDGRLVVDEAAR